MEGGQRQAAVKQLVTMVSTRFSRTHWSVVYSAQKHSREAKGGCRQTDAAGEACFTCTSIVAAIDKHSCFISAVVLHHGAAVRA